MQVAAALSQAPGTPRMRSCSAPTASSETLTTSVPRNTRRMVDTWLSTRSGNRPLVGRVMMGDAPDGRALPRCRPDPLAEWAHHRSGSPIAQQAQLTRISARIRPRTTTVRPVVVDATGRAAALQSLSNDTVRLKGSGVRVPNLRAAQYPGSLANQADHLSPFLRRSRPMRGTTLIAKPHADRRPRQSMACSSTSPADPADLNRSMRESHIHGQCVQTRRRQRGLARPAMPRVHLRAGLRASPPEGTDGTHPLCPRARPI